MKVSFKRKIYGDLTFSSGFSLNLVEKSYGVKQPHCLTFCNFFKNLLFLKNYPAKSEFKGLIEKKDQLCESYRRKRLCP